MENLLAEIGFSVFPKRHTCDGENISPEIRISRLDAPYLAIILTDPGEGGGKYHWLIWNIRETEVIPEGIPKEKIVQAPITAVQGTNSFGKIGYSGPCLPQGAAHEYYFNVYSLDALLELPPGASHDELMDAMEGHMIQYSGFAMATYRKE
ncbi:MAG: YbhB/YbcL family Raf kinase inhibitor-like protein [Methanomicrobiales archaeon]|nr:YbhB/YbcL family Raf kinase inhibitor-like protein [Methanomicrobiales archaeon]